MDRSTTHLVNSLMGEDDNILSDDEDDNSFSDDEDLNMTTFYRLLIAVEEFNLKQIQEILTKSNNYGLLTKQDKNNKDNTLLHVALKNINEETDINIALDVIKYLIEHGAPVDKKNALGKTPINFLEKCCYKVKINWNPIKIIFQLKNSEFNKIAPGNINKSKTNNDLQFFKGEILKTKSSSLQLGKRRFCEDDQNTEQGSSAKKHRSNIFDLPKPRTGETGLEQYNTVDLKQSHIYGIIYQLRILMLFFLRISDDQKFFLTTEMEQAGKFDDIVIKYQTNSNWRYKFIGVKHRCGQNTKIEKTDIFNTDNSSFSLEKYFLSYRTIKQNSLFHDGDLDELLLYTNVGFSDNTKQYFEYTQENGENLILGNSNSFEETGPQRYRLSNQKFHEIRQKLNCDSTKENDFLDFTKKFRILVNYEDSIINQYISQSLKEYFPTNDTQLAFEHIYTLFTRWFHSSQRNGKHKILQNKDRNEVLESTKNIFTNRFVSNYSSLYIEELKRYGICFETPLLNINDFVSNGENISTLITSSPKLSTIKLSQIFSEFKFRENDIIFLFANKLKTYEEIMTVFFYEPTYHWLIMECQRGEKINKSLLSYISGNKIKKVIIVGHEEDILDLSKNCIYDKNNSYKELKRFSQMQLLKKQVIFQGKEVVFDQLIDICSAKKILDEMTLERLLVHTVKIGDDYALNSKGFDEDCYISRTLLKKEFKPEIFQNDNLLTVALFFITGVNKNDLKTFNIKNKWIFSWKQNETYKNGIVLIQEKMEYNDIFFKLCQSNKNVYWIECVNGTFLLKDIANSTLKIPNIFLQEDDLCNKDILENKIIIISNGPGYGKSTYLTKVARQLKKIMPELWVIRVNLASYAYKKKKYYQEKSLEDISFLETETEEAIKFLAHICVSEKYTNENEQITKTIFMESLLCSKEDYVKYPKIILLFDGFDEISPNFKEKTLVLFKALKSSNITQMWITTRVHEEHSLETALESSALFLKPLNDNDKVEFVSKSWKNAIKMISSEIVNEKEASVIQKNNLVEGLATHFIKELSSNKLSDLSDNLLQLKIFAEVVFLKVILSANTELRRVQLSFLFEEFTNTKFKVYYEDNDVADHPLGYLKGIQIHLKYLRRCYQKIAFNILFPQYDNKQSREFSDKVEFQRDGLLTINNNNLEFIHRSFAEYFLSEYLAENFGSRQIQILFFEVILPNEDYQLIRAFLNNNQQFLEKLSNKSPEMVDIINKTNYVPQIYKMANEKNYNLIVKYLQNLPCNLVEDAVLFNINEQGETILHFFCRKIKDNQIFVNLLDAVRNSLSHNNLKGNILHKLILQTDNQGNTALHMTCKNSSKEIVVCLLESVKNNTDVLKNLLLKTNHDGETAFYSAVKSYDYNILKLQVLLDFLKVNCDSEFINLVIFKVDSKERTILHSACDNICTTTQSIEERKEMLSCLLEVLKNNVELRNKTILKADNHGQTALHYTVYKFENSIMLKVLLDFVKMYCSSDIIGELLSTVDNDGCNILHFACCGNQEILNFLSKALKDDKETLQDFLFKKDKFGNTALDYALCNFSEFSLPKALLDFVQIDSSSKNLHLLVRNMVQYILSPSSENISSG